MFRIYALWRGSSTSALGCMGKSLPAAFQVQIIPGGPSPKRGAQDDSSRGGSRPDLIGSSTFTS